MIKERRKPVLWFSSGKQKAPEKEGCKLEFWVEEAAGWSDKGCGLEEALRKLTKTKER